VERCPAYSCILDPTETEWTLSDYQATPDETELGCITSDGGFTGYIDGDNPGTIALRKLEGKWRVLESRN
jgi:hypothetical protein